MNTDGG